MSNLIRVSEAAQILKVTPATIRNMIDRGSILGAQKIDPTRKNSPYRIPRSEVEKLLTGQSHEKAAL